MKKFLKIAGIGCGSLIGLFIIIGIIGAIFSSDTETETISENSEIKTKVVDSLELKRQQKVKDSLALIATANREKAEKDLKSFKKNEDEFKGTAFYKDPRTPYYTNVNFIYPYIGQKGDNYWLRLQFQYASDDWLFIEKGILLIDGEQFTITGNWERDNNSGIWEWLDMPVGETELFILNKLADSKSAKIRYEGRQYYKDRTITSKEKSIIKKTLEIYNNLK
ncbi:MAG TPA: hypothetical protein PKL31_17005 [Fulvivirga sp.]|nr:hypothetical protein [Fulvivirga sp.]